MFENNPKLKIIFWLNFLLSLQAALLAYINSSFLASIVGEEWVGLVYMAGASLNICTLLLAPKIFNKLGGRKFLLTIIGIEIFSLLFLSFTQNGTLIVLFFIAYLCLNTLSAFCLDEILKIFSEISTTGKLRGLYFAFGSFAWILSQFLFFVILGKLPLDMIYFIAALVVAACFLISFRSLKNISEPTYDKPMILQNIKKFFGVPNLLRAYTINFLLQFFYSWMIIYTPLYLHEHLGFTWGEIGIIFAVMLIPFSILPFPLGKYADKIGERKILMLGFLITGFSTLYLFFIKEAGIWHWALALLSTRIGAAMIESMSDIYFFKHINPENEEFIGVYRSASPLSYIIGPFIALIVLAFVPAFNYIYIVLGALMLSGIFLSERIKTTDI